MQSVCQAGISTGGDLRGEIWLSLPQIALCVRELFLGIIVRGDDRELYGDSVSEF